MILIAVYVLLWIINFLLAANNKKNRFVAIATYILFYLLFAGRNCVSGDALHYKLDYEVPAVENMSVEIGYSFLKFISHSVGIESYNVFLAVAFLFFSFLMYKGIEYFNINYHVLYAVTMWYIFPLMVTAIRFFFAFCVSVYSLKYLYESRLRKFVLGIIIATTLHTTGITGFLLLLCTNNTKHKLLTVFKKYIKRIVFMLSLITTPIIFFSKKNIFDLRIFTWLLFLHPEMEVKINSYFSSITRYGAIIFLVIYVAMLLFCYLNMLDKYCERNVKHTISPENVKNICLVWAYCLPLIVLNLTFFRLLLMPTLLVLLVFSQNMNLLKDIRVKITFIWMVILWITPGIFELFGISAISIIKSSVFYGGI